MPTSSGKGPVDPGRISGAFAGQIRDGRPGDVDAMHWASTDEQRTAWHRQVDRAETGEVDFLVAELGGRVLGKAVLDWARRADGTPWLWMVSVDPGFRSRGIGSGLLAEAEGRAQRRGHTAIELAVDDGNPRARALYVRKGYAAVRPHLDEYDVTQPDGRVLHMKIPGVVLRKTLPGVRAVVCDLDGVVRGFDSRVQADVEHRHGLPGGAIARAAFNPVRLTPAITGGLSDERWRATVAEDLDQAFPFVDAAGAVAEWSAHLGYVVAEVLSLLDRIRQRVPVILLTNATSRLHEDLDALDLTSHFDAIVSSTDIGVAKPEPGAYAAIEAVVNGLVGAVEPASLLFVDDSDANVAAASARGWQAVVFTSSDDLEATLTQVGLVDKAQTWAPRTRTRSQDLPRT
jgi:putative hydrolase of the HAD superfamily